MEASAVGIVASLWRYPVKSMMGEELNASIVTERGLLGDRAFALTDRETGKVAPWTRPLVTSSGDCRFPVREPAHYRRLALEGAQPARTIRGGARTARDDERGLPGTRSTDRGGSVLLAVAGQTDRATTELECAAQ